MPAPTTAHLVIAAVVPAVFLAGCRAPVAGGPAANSRATAPMTSEPPPAQRAPTYGVTATVPVGEHPGAVAVDPETHTVYVADDLGVSVIDGTTHTVTATIGVQGSELAVDPGTHTVYVTQPGEYAVSVIDGLTHTVTATVPVGEKPQMIGNSPMREVAVDPGSHIVYVTKDSDKTVAVIDGATRTITDTISGLGGVGAIAVDPDTLLVYVTNVEDDTLSVIDGKGARPTYAVIDTIAVGKGPIDVAVDSGNHTVYVVGRGELSVIDGPTRTVTATIPINSASGHSVAVDPGTHTVYVTNTADGTVSVIERR